jgi:hypothetical protein
MGGFGHADLEYLELGLFEVRQTALGVDVISALDPDSKASELLRT